MNGHQTSSKEDGGQFLEFILLTLMKGDILNRAKKKSILLFLAIKSKRK